MVKGSSTKGRGSANDSNMGLVRMVTSTSTLLGGIAGPSGTVPVTKNPHHSTPAVTTMTKSRTTTKVCCIRFFCRGVVAMLVGIRVKLHGCNKRSRLGGTCNIQRLQ